MFTLTKEIERDLRPETPIAQRIRTLRELENVVLTRNLEEVILNLSGAHDLME